MPHSTSAEAPADFHVLLQAFCLEQGIATPAMLAERLNLDPKLTQKWWNGKRTPGTNNETAILRLLQPLPAPAVQEWNRLIELARRRRSGGGLKDGDDSPPSISSSASEEAADTVAAAADPVDVSAPESVTPSLEDGTSKNPAVETEPPLPVDGGGEAGQPAPDDRKAQEDPPPASDEIAPSARQDVAMIAPAVGRRQVAAWIGAAAVLIGALGAMPYPSARGDAGDRCDALAAAIWDAQKPAGLKGVRFRDIDTTEAMTACQEAVSSHDANPRYHFQLGRVLDRRKDYPHAFSEYLKAIDKDSSYAPPFLNIGILYEHGQMNGKMRAFQLLHRDLATAAERYGQAADLDLPNGRYCYAISLLFDWNSRGPDSARAASELRKARDGAVRRGVERDEALIHSIDELINDLQSQTRNTTHVSCDPLRGINLGRQIIPK